MLITLYVLLWVQATIEPAIWFLHMAERLSIHLALWFMFSTQFPPGTKSHGKITMQTRLYVDIMHSGHFCDRVA